MPITEPVPTRIPAGGNPLDRRPDRPGEQPVTRDPDGANERR